MKTTRIILATLATTFLGAVLAADAPALPVEVKPSDPNIVYLGRFDRRDPSAPRSDWPGTSVLIHFSGTAINAKMKTSANDYVQVIVDGESKSTIQLTKEPAVYALASGLADKEHTVEIFKRTETYVGQFTFLGVQLPAGKKLLPVKRAERRIEIVGDSISCGYGNEAPSQNEKFTAATENNYMAYGAIAARELKAEYSCIAISGRWMMENPKGEAMPAVYPRTLSSDPNFKLDTASWVPDVIVINLCTNDFGPANPDETKWTDAYKAFITTLKKSYPKAHVFCAVGSMMSDGYPKDRKALTTVRGYCNAVVDHFRKAGDAAVHYVEFAPQDMANGIGADWHPNIKTNQIMAAKLVEAVKKELKW